MDVSRVSAGKLTLERPTSTWWRWSTAASTTSSIAASSIGTATSCAARHARERRRPPPGTDRQQPPDERHQVHAGRRQIIIEVEPDGSDAVLRVKDTGVGIFRASPPRLRSLRAERTRPGSARGRPRRGAGNRAQSGRGARRADRCVELGPQQRGGVCGSSSAGGHSLLQRPAGGRGARRRILVVDDNVDAREALARLLEIAGHEVYQAGDGPGGLEQLPARARMWRLWTSGFLE